MNGFAIKLEYDGTNYVGYQVQPNGDSIQAQLERALSRIAKLPKGEKIPTISSGRTDAGVHARGQVVQFTYPGDIAPANLCRALNSILPEAIRVIAVTPVASDFHARYSSVSKYYRFVVHHAPFPDPFTRLYALHHPYPTDLQRMQMAIQAIVGEHDFTSFCSTKTDKVDLVRTIYDARIEKDDDYFHFYFVGNGFLYNMIRIIVGTLLQIGDGLKPVDELERLIQVRDRRQAGPTAGGNGLFLMEVGYPVDPFDHPDAFVLE